MKRSSFVFIFLVIVIGAAASKRYWSALLRTPGAQHTVADRVKEFGAATRTRLSPHFAKAAVTYPPARLVLVGIKSQRRLEVYGGDAPGPLRFIRAYPILRASGNLGPKLEEGDRQVPEGIYRIESLNPNSRFHLALRVGYPNDFDREQAHIEGRTNLGGDIMIHGGVASVGCLAMGDEAAEDLFVMAALTGLKNIQAILTPVDFRREKMPGTNSLPGWTKPLYEKVAARLSELPLPN